ncbi:MAG: glycosyltransferase [Bryobacterales bacterium]|nr:glycosyltransferase [Bryobacterales bacterium]
MPSILLLTTGLAIGGAEAQVALLARSLRQRGWQVGVVSMIPPRAYATELEGDGIVVNSLGMRPGIPDPRGLLRLRSLLRRFRPHVLHCHMVHANLLGRIARLFTAVPVVVSTAHSIHEGGTWRDLAYRATDWLSDVTTNVSQRGLHRYFHDGLIKQGRGLWIPNGLDLHLYRRSPDVRAKARMEEGWTEDFVWLAVGNLREPKDYPTMFRAHARLRQQGVSARLAIAGTGHLEAELRSLALGLGIEHQVRFLGTRGDVPRLLQAADAFVMSSSWEGTPMALLEASAAELPAVATDVGGIGEVIVDGKTGLLVPSGDPSALSDAMRRVLTMNPRDRLALGRAARERVEQYYAIGVVTSLWEELYMKTLSQRVPGNPLLKEFVRVAERGTMR